MGKDKRHKERQFENCVTKERTSMRSIALDSKKQHDKWEAENDFETIHVDKKTTIFRHIKKKKR